MTSHATSARVVFDKIFAKINVHYDLPTYYRLQSILSIQGIITYVMILLLYTAMLYNKALKNKVSLRNC